MCIRDRYEDNLLLSEVVKKVQQIRDEGLAENYMKANLLSKTASVSFHRDYPYIRHNSYNLDDDIPF